MQKPTRRGRTFWRSELRQLLDFDQFPVMRPPQCGIRLLNLCNSFSELGILGFGLLVDGSVGIGALPQIQESLVGLPCSGFIAPHLLRAAKLEPGQGSRDMSHAKTGIVDQLLELSRGRLAIAERQVRESADVCGVQIEGSRK